MKTRDRNILVALLLITIVLCLLRLLEVISWAWWILLSPLWIYPAVAIGILLFGIVISIITIIFIFLMAIIGEIEDHF